MSRSFYVDSLIVKRPSPIVSGDNTSLSQADLSPLPISHITSAPHHHHHPLPHIPTTTPIPCYPRHPPSMLSLCCPLCIHTPSALMSDGPAAVPGLKQAVSTGSVLPSIATSLGMIQRRQLQLQTPPVSVHHSALQSSPTGIQTLDQRRIRYSNVGKFLLIFLFGIIFFTSYYYFIDLWCHTEKWIKPTLISNVALSILIK